MARDDVEFWAKKKITKRVPVEFVTRYGETVSFNARKHITKPVKVKFKTKR